MKTPKDKAKELVEKYENYVFCDPNKELPIKEFQIECAKIAVYEIVEQWEYIDTYLSDMGGKLNPNLSYWKEVKNELNKM